MSRSFGGRSLTIRSPIVISPAVISSSPATIRKVVDLPHPEGPTSTTNSLSRMWRFTSLTACTSSYFLLRSFRTTWAMWSSPSMVSPESGAPGAMGDGARPSPGFRDSTSTLHRPGEAGDVVLDEEGIDEGHRDRPEQGPGHELAPEVDVAADQLRHHADRDGLLLRGGQEHERVDELVPRQREGEDAGGEDAGHGDREDD